jgi:putative effector of murein hydrolase
VFRSPIRRDVDMGVTKKMFLLMAMMRAMGARTDAVQSMIKETVTTAMMIEMIAIEIVTEIEIVTMTVIEMGIATATALTAALKYDALP